MRIVLLSTGHPAFDVFPNGGGIQHQILGLATEMAKQGHEVHVICRAVEDSAQAKSGVVYHPLFVRAKDQIVSVLMFSRKAASLIESIEPDVVSTFERFSAYFPSLSPRPMTFTTENYDAFRYYRQAAIEYNPLNALVHPWKCHLEEGVMRRSDLVIALTDSIKHYLCSIGMLHVQVIPNGVAVEDYSNQGDGNFVLYAGRLDTPKRVDLLIEAYATLTEFHKQYPLVIVGKGPRRNALLKLAQDKGIAPHMDFRDWVSREQLISLLGKCTVFVLPSDYETFGIALLQAMACSKPVIASKVSGPRDIIHDGVDGLLFEPGNRTSLAAALARCLSSRELRVHLGLSARKTVQKSYDFGILAGRTLSAYAQVIA